MASSQSFDELCCATGAFLQGTCDVKTGLCKCFAAFTGSACQRRACAAARHRHCGLVVVRSLTHGMCVCGLCFAVKCPGVGEECSGHGMCYVMSDYNRRYNKTDTQSAYKYTLWDHDMTTACECDEGYSGHDCNLR